MSKLKLAIHSRDHYLGSINSAITLVEYGDFECPHCKHAHSLIKRLLKDKPKDLCFAFRNFPLQEIHTNAYAAAMAAEAAGKQDKFWEMHDLIFENQDKLNPNFLFSLAEKIGADMSLFAKDFKSKKLENKIETDFESGVRSGVNGTPSFFINGLSLFTYDDTYESLLDAVILESEMTR